MRKAWKNLNSESVASIPHLIGIERPYLKISYLIGKPHLFFYTAPVDKENPLGLLAIDHLEFTVDRLSGPTRNLFYLMGMARTHQGEESELFTQGQIRFLLNAGAKGPHRKYFQDHGEGVSKISFRVKNAAHALETAVNRGAEAVNDLSEEKLEEGLYRKASIKGFGDVLNEFVEAPPSSSERPQMTILPQDPKAAPLNTRVSRIDHLTNNVPKGELPVWEEFYRKIYGFVETRYFDIKGKKTGLISKVMQLPNNSIIIPINEPDEDQGKSQIQEFLDEHKGAGVQHIALSTPHIISTIEQLKERGLSFLEVPDTYYRQLAHRPFTVSEDISELNKLRLLADGDEKGYLLQIFTKTAIGPLFFEFIQRKNHQGFGEGNFQALFDAIERDQVERGFLNNS